MPFRQATNWTNANINWALWNKFQWNSNQNKKNSWKMGLNMSSAKWQPFCPEGIRKSCFRYGFYWVLNAWLRWKIVPILKSHTTPIPRHQRQPVGWGVYCECFLVLGNIYLVLTAPHCNWIAIFMAFFVPNILENIIVNSEKHLLCNLSYLVDECTGLGLDPRDVADNFTNKMSGYLYMYAMILSSNTTNTMYTMCWLCNSWGAI